MLHGLVCSGNRDVVKPYSPCGKEGDSKDSRILRHWNGDTQLSSALVLFRSGSGVHWAVVVDGSRSTDDWFGVRGSLGLGCGDASVTARGDVDLHLWLLRGAGVWGSTKRATTWQVTNGGLCPALALDWDAGGGTEILLELVAVVGLRMGGRTGERDASLAPGLSGVFILSRAELTSCLRLLLERLLLLSIGVSDLDLHFLAARLECVVVEISDDILAGFTRLEANHIVSDDEC